MPGRHSSNQYNVWSCVSSNIYEDIKIPCVQQCRFGVVSIICAEVYENNTRDGYMMTFNETQPIYRRLNLHSFDSARYNHALERIRFQESPLLSQGLCPAASLSTVNSV